MALASLAKGLKGASHTGRVITAPPPHNHMFLLSQGLKALGNIASGYGGGASKRVASRVSVTLKLSS